MSPGTIKSSHHRLNGDTRDPHAVGLPPVDVPSSLGISVDIGNDHFLLSPDVMALKLNSDCSLDSSRLATMLFSLVPYHYTSAHFFPCVTLTSHDAAGKCSSGVSIGRQQIVSASERRNASTALSNSHRMSESLKDYFSEFGEVLECTVMRDGATGRSRGFGFLTFKDPKTVNTVMVKEHYLDGKIVSGAFCFPLSSFVKGFGCHANKCSLRPLHLRDRMCLHTYIFSTQQYILTHNEDRSQTCHTS